MNFKDTLQIHLDALQKKDLASFSATISSDSITLIMPNGTLINNRKDFIELHEEWFSDEDWRLNYEVINIEETSEIAYALLSVVYDDCDREGNPVSMNYYLNLIFKKYKEDWLLVFDQNTIFKDK